MGMIEDIEERLTIRLSRIEKQLQLLIIQKAPKDRSDKAETISKGLENGKENEKR